MSAIPPCEFFAAGDLSLDSGETLVDAKIGYVTFGELNAKRDNAIIMPTHFGGTHENSLYLTGAGKALDTSKYFIVIANLLGNGVSSSPSHGLGIDFPKVSICDNVRLQYRLLTEHLGAESLSLAVGHSMGAVQAYHWAAMYPNFVQRVVAICGAAKISTHNYVFLEGMRGILQADPVWNGGRYKTQPVNGLATMARAWAAWPPSANFYRNKYYERLGFKTVDDFLSGYWEAFYTSMDANNVLTQISTWQSADLTKCNDNYTSFEDALQAITARVTVMPSRTDAYFPPEDSEIEVAHLKNGRLNVIESLWGHWAGSDRNPDDTAFIEKQISALLAA